MFSDSYMRKSHPNKLATVPNTFPLWTLQGHLSVLFLPSEEECTLINVVLVNIVIYHHKKNKNKQKSNSKSSYGIWYYISYLSILSFFSVTPHTLQAGKHENIWPHPSYRQDAEAKSIWPECKKKYPCRGLWVQTLRLEKCMDSNKHIISPLSNSSVENIQVISSNF